MPAARSAPGRRQLARCAAAVAALLAVGGWVTGLPTLLWHIGGNPIPASLPTPDEVLQALTRPDDGTLLVQLLVVVGWLTWVSFCVQLTAEIIARVAGRQLNTPPTLPGQRRLAGLLIGTIAAIAAPAAAHAGPEPAPAPATIDPQETPPAAATSNRDTASQTDHLQHLVDRGEALLDLQERYGLPWARIAQANYGTPQPDGRSLQPGQTRIYPGWQMRIPTTQPTPTAVPTIPANEQPGGQNPDGQPDDQQEEVTYQVATGDWLWHIAERMLGDPQRYHEIADLNDQYHGRHSSHPDGPNRLVFPDYIEPGWRLTMPPDAHDRGTGRHATGTTQAETNPAEPPPPPPEPPPATPPPPPPHPTDPPATPEPDPDPTPPHTPTTAPETAVPAPDDGVVEAPPSKPPTATSTPSQPPTRAPASPAPPPAIPDGEDPPPSPDGVDLPSGGWIAVPLAAAIAAAAALATINRRRRWRPGDTPTTQELPELVQHLRPPAAGDAGRDPTERTQHPHPSDPLREGNQTTPTARDDELIQLEHTAAAVTPATVGTDRHQPLQLDTLPPHGTALAGGGAPAAARGLLAATLAAGGPHRPDQAAEAITTADLLADLELADPDLPRLSVATSIHHALNLLQIEINRRYHVLDDELDHPAGDLPDPPLLVLLSGGIGQQHLHRLDALVSLGRHVGVRTVLLGTWPDRLTWQVAADGHTTGADQPGLRLNTLTPQSAGEILATLTEAHTEPPEHPAPPAVRPAATPAPPASPGPQPPPAPDAAGKPDRLLLRLLGKPSVEAPGQRKVKIQRAAAMHIATYLASHPQGASKDEILEQVLGDKTMRSASQTFDSAIHQLRRALTHPATGHSAIGRHRNGHYHLDPQVIDVDWWQLQHAVDTGNPQQVLALYQGPLAHGIDQDWLAAPRQHAHNLALTAHDQLADTANGPDQALAHIEAALQLDPYNEHFYRRAMRIHADRGDHTAARRMLKRLTDRLATLGAEATQETRDLAAQLITNKQRPTTVPEPPPSNGTRQAPVTPARGPVTPARDPGPVQGHQPQRAGHLTYVPSEQRPVHTSTEEGIA